MIEKKILSLAASITKLIIINLFLLQTVVYATEKQYQHNEQGILSLMYHRFDENKYPSTNIKMDVFKKQIEIIKRNNFEFFDPKNFSEEFNKVKTDKKILITIDDAFLSFYENAWPFLKENQIPFILFTSTDFIGKKGYMNIDQLREVEKESFAYVGNHSHMHEYMVTFDFNKFTNDIDRSIEIFNNLFNYNPIFFSYPFGEYSLEQKNYISSKFEYAFGQHSGVIDLNKDPYELPRFPINEKYGDLKRFEFLIKLLPLQYSKIIPEDKLIINNNPPKMEIEFFREQKNLSAINCFSDEGGSWNNSNIELIENTLVVHFREKFNFRRGRINCSLNDNEGWRWFGSQFSIILN
jgi:peptidoglycan/xylan/chitin deacetylase (PgdA/CDA1 family)